MCALTEESNFISFSGSTSPINSFMSSGGPYTKLWETLIWKTITQPEWSLTLQLPHPNPITTISSQWSYSCCVLVFIPDCSSLKPPPRSRLSDQTIAAAQVFAPVTIGFTFAKPPPFSAPQCVYPTITCSVDGYRTLPSCKCSHGAALSERSCQIAPTPLQCDWQHHPLPAMAL